MAQKKDSWAAAGRALAERLDALGGVSDEAGGLTRTFLSPAMKEANALVGTWMKEAGLQVREDDVGNLIGRLEPTESRRVPARTLVLGSHLDTVRNAGRFDGALGVVLPIVALAELRRIGVALPFAVEVVGFSEEEGVRFSRPYFGSKGYAGRLTSPELAQRDADGISVREALEGRLGRRFAPNGAAIQRRGCLGYLEVHIEQGPVLEVKRLAVGTVTGIASQHRGSFDFTGQSGHAGTTPMELRRDALAGAAEFIVAVEEFAKTHAPLLATVGLVQVANAAGNVIAGQACVSLDVRHPTTSRCRQAVARLVALAKSIARRRGLHCEWKPTLEQRATVCSRAMKSLLSASVRHVQGRDCPLVSGAGHDAVVMADTTDVAMLFVRCRGGLSHHPDEYATAADLTVALRVIGEFIRRLAAREARAVQPRRRR